MKINKPRAFGFLALGGAVLAGLVKGYTLRVVGVVSLLALGLPLAGSAAPSQKLSGGHVPRAVARSQPIGRLPATNQLRLAIGLPLRDPSGLENLLAQLYDPASANFRQYLTPEEFTARFGPTEQDYQAVKDFAKSNGLRVTVTHPNRVVLDVEATVTDIQKAFHLTLRTYRHPREAREFYAPDVEPSVDLAVPILHVSGLDNYSLPHPISKVRRGGDVVNATPNAGTGPGGTYRGSDFRKAYVPGTTLTGAGQSVGLLQFDGFYTNDIATYASQAGLPNVPVTVVPVNGGVSTPGSGNSEVCLDIEMVMSMAPGVTNIYVYEAPNNTIYFDDLLNRMANDNLSSQLSSSWGGGPPNATAEQIFKQMASQGQSFFNASGDSDAFTGDIPFPSDSPSITVVGGTKLTTGTGATYESESVWNDRTLNLNGGNWGSSGGISTYYPIASYQQGVSMVTNQGSTTMRNVPDVGLTAEDVWVIFGNGQSGSFVGTSAAAPLWAGFTALINQQAAVAGLAPVGFLNPALYSIGRGANYLAAFNDITTGDNYWSGSPTNYPAVSGYDLCTGWGTPNGTNLINILTVGPVGPPSHPSPPSPPVIVSQPQSQTVTAGAGVTFTVIATGTPRFSHQWFFNGQPISAATSYSYSIARVQSIQAGTYAVVVTNSFGSVTSAPAILAIVGGTAFGIIGAPFSYQIAANNNPTWYSASGLPSGLSCNGTNGLISGIPTRTGIFSVHVEARNLFGSASADISLTIADGAITSATIAEGVIGAPFNYQIAADNSPTWYSASGLPSGLSCNGTNGLISGTPTQTGTFSIHVEARNLRGTASATSSFTIADGAITSEPSAQGVIGGPFSYQIAANNSPTWYSASGLPSGLSCNGNNGSISGTPTQTGTFSVHVEARNLHGTAAATIFFTIADGAITSPTSAQGVIGVPFSYQIAANNSPTWYSASGLPSGLSCNGPTGLISGIPTQTGTFSVHVEASNLHGTASATIFLTIADGAITSPTSAQGVIGAPFSYQIAANNSPTLYSASGLPSGLGCNVATGLISGIPTQTGTFSVHLEASNLRGTASATISLTVSDGTIGSGSRPTLTLLQTGDSLRLTWPVTSDRLVLEETQGPPNAWTNSSAQVVVQGNENVAVIAATGTAKFYRLRK
jgi:hypothetical protein